MERQLKERLIGAAVLIALAVILVPEMFTGTGGEPASVASAVSARTQVSAASTEQVKTYSIDLQSTPQSSVPEVAQPAPEPVVEASSLDAPSPAESGAASVGSSIAEEQVASAASASVSVAKVAASSVSSVAKAAQSSSKPAERVAATVKASPQKEQPARNVDKPVEKPVEMPAAKPLDSATGDWVVQVGSFGAQDKAKQIASELKNQGMSAFVVPVTVKGKTLYRVRIGPMARNKADATLQKLGSRYAGASVVAASK